MQNKLYNIIVFTVVAFLQIFIFNNIELGRFINIYFYIYAILIFPLKTNNIVLMLLAFILGGTIDLFSNTFGIHTFATTFIAFVRPYLLKLMTTQDDIDKPALTIKHLGLSLFLRYMTILVTSHYFLLFLLETYSFDNIFHLLLKTVFSSLATVLLITLTDRIISK